MTKAREIIRLNLDIQRSKLLLMYKLLGQGFSAIYDIKSVGICALFIYKGSYETPVGLMARITEKGCDGIYLFETYQEALNSMLSWRGEYMAPGNWKAYKGKKGDRFKSKY